MKSFIKYIIGSIISLVAIGGIFTSSITLAGDALFPYDNGVEIQDKTNMGQMLRQTNQGGSVLENYLDLFGLNYADKGQGKAIVYVQVVINYILALLGMIALVLILYSFYSIFFSSKSDDAIANARKTVVGAAIGLALVGLSAYIVNFIFYIYNKGL